MLGIGIGIGRRHPSGQVVAPGGGDPPEVAVNAVHFDGTNDYLLRGADLTGNAESKVGICSFWVNFGATATALAIFQTEGTFVVLNRLASGVVALTGNTSAPVNNLELRTNTTFDETNGWAHLLCAWDVAAGIGQVYVNDLDDLDVATDIVVDGLIDYTRSNHAIGAQVSANLKLDGDLAEFYFNTAEFLDLTVVSNRRKFISAAGKPVDLGSDGSDPTGTAPIIYLSGDTISWHTNDGSGEGFTEFGALTDAATSPSD